MSVRQKFGMILENKVSKIEAIKKFQQEMFLETVFHTKILGYRHWADSNPLIVYHVTKTGRNRVKK